MDSLPYVDTLFKEYLLFRGFTATLQSFGAELAADRCCGFQAEALCELIFGQLLPQCRTTQLMELLELLADRLYSQLDGRFEVLVERMEVAIIKAALVTCVRAGRQDKVAEFFRQHGDSLLSGPEAGVWRQWAALAFVPTPRKDPAFQAYFSPEWISLLEVSFRNFLSQVMSALPLPAVLRFNADRRQRLALQQQVDSLKLQLEAVTQQLAVAQEAAAAAEARQRTDGEGKGGQEGAAPASPLEAAAGTSAQGKTPSQPPPPTAAATTNMSSGAGDPSTAPPGTLGRRGAGGGGGSGALQTSTSAAAAMSASRPRHGGDGGDDGARRPKASLPLQQPSPPPPSPSPPRASSPPLQQQQQQPQHPHHHPPHHHGRTLSLEAWHAVVDAEEKQEVAAVPAPGAFRAAAVRATGGGSGGGGGSLVSRSAAFEGFAATEPRGGSPPLGTAGSVDRGSSSRDAPTVTTAPTPTPTAAPSSPSQRSVAVLPPLAEADVEPSPTPLAVASPPRFAPHVAAAVSGAAGAPPLPPSPAAGGDDADAEADVDGEEDPAVMLVSGPTEPSAVGHQAPRGRAIGSSGSINTLSDGGGDSEGPSRRAGDEGDDDGATATADEEGQGGEEGLGDDEAGEASGSGGGGGATVAAEALEAEGGPAPAGTSSSGPRSRPRPPPAGGAIVVGGGRWQGVSTHTASPGALHGRGAAVLAAQFSPGGGHNVATAAADGSVAIWSPAASSSSSPREARLTCGAPATCVAWDARADKVMLVGTAGHGILAWHADTRRTAAEIPPDPAFPWVTQLACSRKDPVFIVAAATAPPPGSRPTAAAAAAAAAVASRHTTAPASAAAQRVLSPPHPSPPHPSHRHPAAASAAASPGTAGGGAAGGSSAGGGGGGSSSSSRSSISSGRLSLWNMRAYKRVSSYTVPQSTPVLSLAFNSPGSWFATGTCCGDVHLYDSSSSGSKPNPLSSFRANSTPGSPATPSASAPAAVQVYDSAAETVLVTCCGATVRLWSLRRLAEPLLSVPLLPYLPYGGGAGNGWSPDWVPHMCLSPRGAAAAVVLGGGGPAVYLVDLQSNGADEAAGGGGGGGGSGTWLSGVFGSPTTASLTSVGSAGTLNWMAVAAAGRVSVILPYSGSGGGLGLGAGGGSFVGVPLDLVGGRPVYDLGGGSAGGGGDGDEWVYGTSCGWHPTRDVLVVGYNDGAVQTVGLSRALGGNGGGSGGGGA